ncbi:TRAP transporter TatT component family protein [Lysobacter fragariae]
MTSKRLPLVLVLLPACLLAGCASLVDKASSRFASNLGTAILNSEDPGTVRDGLPAYLLLLDSLIVGQKPGEPANAGTLLAAAKLNGAYAGNFTGTDKLRAQRMSKKALDYARTAACLKDAGLCDALDKDLDVFTAAVGKSQDAELLYALASSWAGFLQSNSEDWGAIIELPKIEALLQRAIAINPNLEQGQPYVYLGVINSLRPEAIGGQPAKGRGYFEKAIELSQGRNLYAKTLMAEFYARLMFDQELHDRLLNEVIATDPKSPGYTLMNTLAQDRAKQLLESGKDYF